MNRTSMTDLKRIDALTDSEIAEAVAADADAAPIADEETFKRARPASQVVTEVVEWHRRGRGSQKEPTKIPVSIRLSPEVISYFKTQGKGWQSRLNEILQEYVASQQ